MLMENNDASDKDQILLFKFLKFKLIHLLNYFNFYFFLQFH